MPGTFSPPPQVNHPDMHHGTCMTHVPWCIPGSLTSGFHWSRWQGKRAFPAHAQPAILRIWQEALTWWWCKFQRYAPVSMGEIQMCQSTGKTNIVTYSHKYQYIYIYIYIYKTTLGQQIRSSKRYFYFPENVLLQWSISWLTMAMPELIEAEWRIHASVD